MSNGDGKDNSRAAAAEAQVPSAWGAIMEQFGFPPPAAILTELQRFNATLESMRPALNTLAEAAPAIHELATATKEVSPKDIRDLTGALKETSAMGKNLQDRLWPK